jgi:hypothetical protein
MSQPLFRSLICESIFMAKKPKPGLAGPVTYCPVCLHKTGIYKPRKGGPAGPVAGNRCGGCKKRAKDRKAKLPSEGPSTSVRAISGGLPTLGKGHR